MVTQYDDLVFLDCHFVWSHTLWRTLCIKGQDLTQNLGDTLTIFYHKQETSPWIRIDSMFIQLLNYIIDHHKCNFQIKKYGQYGLFVKQKRLFLFLLTPVKGKTSPCSVCFLSIVSQYLSYSTDCNFACGDVSCIPLGHTGKRLKHLHLGNNVIKGAVLSRERAIKCSVNLSLRVKLCMKITVCKFYSDWLRKLALMYHLEHVDTFLEMYVLVCFL